MQVPETVKEVPYPKVDKMTLEISDLPQDEDKGRRKLEFTGASQQLPMVNIRTQDSLVKAILLTPTETSLTLRRLRITHKAGLTLKVGNIPRGIHSTAIRNKEGIHNKGDIHNRGISNRDTPNRAIHNRDTRNRDINNNIAIHHRGMGSRGMASKDMDSKDMGKVNREGCKALPKKLVAQPASRA